MKQVLKPSQLENKSNAHGITMKCRYKLWLKVLTVSLVVHLVTFAFFMRFCEKPKSRYIPFPVQLKAHSIANKKKVMEKATSIPTPIPKPTPKGFVILKKISHKNPPEKEQSATLPSQGLSPTSFRADEKATTSRALEGNTLQTAYVEKKGATEELPVVEQDLSAAARFIRSTLRTPEYTDDALLANLEGDFLVKVFVSQDGQVTQVEIKDEVGYGMDERIIKALKAARFVPEKSRSGEAISGWNEIKVSLRIP